MRLEHLILVQIVFEALRFHHIEFKEGSPKVNFPFKTMVFKSGERGYPRV